MKAIESYRIEEEGHPINIDIIESKPVNEYHLSLMNISSTTKLVIKKLKEEVVSKISLNFKGANKGNVRENVKANFRKKCLNLMNLVFLDLDKKILEDLTTYVVITSLGLGELEYLLKDSQLEEIVVNGAKQPVFVYHRKYGWLKTNIVFETEAQIRHFAVMIGRNVNKDITVLRPLLDARLESGDRVNATLQPASLRNTLTIRKFSERPWTITDFIKSGTITYDVAALVWQAIQFEQSVFIVGGTGSGKTSTLNVLANFMPPDQRMISIENTRELRLPKNLHWVPMETRMANPEGKGEISMLDLMVNSLRMRPDRILVGEVRNKEEVEVLLEAIKTGHSGYATFHATTVNDCVNRLTNPPMSFPKTELASIGLVVVQFRNRRNGKRRTFQVAEIDENGVPNLLMQYDVATDKINIVNKSKVLVDKIKLFGGMNIKQMKADLIEKEKVLKFIVKKDITDVHEIGKVMSDYYSKKLKV